jgi:hypothetical protein
LDNKAKEGFLVQAGILALSYRKWEGEGVDAYGVVFPEITLHARAIVESIARFTAGIQRLQDETKFGSLLATPRMFLLIAQQSSLWETATPEHLVDLLEAVEFEAAYRTVNDFQRRTLYEFRDYEPLDDTHDLEALYEHYTAFKRKRYRDYARRRFEFWREFPRRPRPAQRPGGGPGGTTAQTPGASRRTEARPAHPPRPAQTSGRPGNGKDDQAQSPARSDAGKGNAARNTAPSATPTAAKPARGSRKSPAATRATTSAETQSDATQPAASPAAVQPAPAPSPVASPDAAAQPPAHPPTAMNHFAYPG